MASRVFGDRAWYPMISTRRVTLRSRLRIRSDRSPNAILARCIVRQDAYPIPQQRAVSRIMHIRGYDRGVDAKSATVRDPGALRDVDHLPMQLRDDVRPEGPGDLQDRLRVGHVAGIDAREHPIHQVGADLAFQVVVTPVEQVLQDQHADDHFRRRARSSATPTLRPARFERVRDNLNHGLVLEQRVDLAQPVGPQFVAIGQQDFEQTPLPLSALHHARSFDESSRAGSLVRRIDRRNRRISNIERLATAGRRPSVPVSDLGGHFFTEK